MRIEPGIESEALNLLVDGIHRRAANLFATRQFMCAEAVLAVLNRTLRGGLEPEMAVRLASGLPEGMGSSGCTCGALSGATLALGLFLGRDTPGFGNGRRVRSATHALHASFRERFGAACCRVLLKNLKRGSASHYRFCTDKTGWTAATATRLIVKQRPRLMERVDWEFLQQKDSIAGAGMKRLFRRGIGPGEYPTRRKGNDPLESV